MFDKLVVSENQKRRGRTPRFFLGTAVVYLSVIASAFALSVVLAEPKLADSNLRLVPSLPVYVTTVRSDNVAADRGNAGPSARHNFSKLQKLEYLIDHPQPGPMRPDVPRGTSVRGDEGGDPNAPPGFGGVIGGNPRASESLPQPPEPTTPPARTKEVDSRPLRVTSTMLQGKVIDRVVPVYPELAKRIRLSGDVSIEVIISPEGRVESVRVVSGHHMLIAAAMDAGKRWRFEPTILNGIPVRVTGVITFVFKLSE